MQREYNLLEVLNNSTDEEASIILAEVSYEIVKIYYDYFIKNEGVNNITYPEYYLLEKLGYNTNDRAIGILRDFILYVVDAINEKGVKEAKKLVKNKNSYIYVELAHYDYEIGFNGLRNELDRLHKSRNIDSVDIELYEDVFGKNYSHDIYDSALLIAKYIRNTSMKKQEKASNKENRKASVQISEIDGCNKVFALA